MPPGSGRKRLLLGAITGFTISTVLCGLSTSLVELIVWRTCQGLFGAPLVPLSQAITLDTYPREQHGTATALWGLGVMLGPILGPTLGGYMTELYDWRWVFFVVAPFGVVALLGCMAFVPDGGREPARRLDWFGFIALSVAVAATQLMFDRGQRQDWFESREIVLWAVVATLGFYLFVTHSLTAARPFFDLRMFLDRNFVVGLVLMAVFGLLVFVPMVLIPTMLERLRGFPVLMIGLLLAPRGLGTMLAMIVCGRLVTPGRRAPAVGAGFLGQGMSTWLMSQFNLDTGPTRGVLGGPAAGLRRRHDVRAADRDHLRHPAGRAAHRRLGAVPPAAQPRLEHRHLARGHLSDPLDPAQSCRACRVRLAAERDPARAACRPGTCRARRASPRSSWRSIARRR